MAALAALNRTLQKLEAAAAAASLLALLALSIAQLLIRNLLEFGYPEIDIINRHLLIVCGLFGATLAAGRGGHIRIDALALLLSARARRRLRPWLLGFAAAVCLALSYYAGIFVLDEWQYTPVNERWTLPFVLVYPLCFALMALHFVLQALAGEDGNEETGHGAAV